MNSDELKRERGNLEHELRESILVGAGERMVRIGKMLTDLQLQIVAREIQELRENLDAVDRRKEELQGEIVALENIRGAKNKDLADSVKEMEKRQLAVRKVELALFAADSERQNLLDSRRELKEKLQKVAQAKMKELGVENGFEKI